MATALKLPPIVEGRHDGDDYWRGGGRYERGDRRDRCLNHWTYGQRVDHARIRRVLAMLAASWHQIDPDDRKGKRFRTSAKILSQIARSLNKVDGISFITKASIAARLGMHRNTIYNHCKAMAMAGVIIQGHYAMPKGSDFKSYSVFGVPGITGRLPVVLRFRRRHARHIRLVEITWPLATIARYGQRALPQFRSPTLVTAANENLFKNVHRTCDYQLSLNQAVDSHRQDSRKRLKGGSGAVPSARHVDIVAAKRGRSPPESAMPVLKRLFLAKQSGHEGIASRFSTSHFDERLSATQRIRDVMQAYEQAFGHLDNYQSIAGFPRGWIRARVLAISGEEWNQLVQLVLSRPMLTGAAPMSDGRIFQLNFWWLMQEAPRLLAQVLVSKPDRSVNPVSGHSAQPQKPKPPQKSWSKAARDQEIEAVSSAVLRDALAQYARGMDEDALRTSDETADDDE